MLATQFGRLEIVKFFGRSIGLISIYPIDLKAFQV